MVDQRVSAVVYRQSNVDDTSNVFNYASYALNSSERRDSVELPSELTLGEFGAKLERPNYPRYVTTAVTRSEYSALL